MARYAVKLRENTPNKSGECPIEIHYTHKGRVRPSVGVSIQPLYWDDHLERVRDEHPESERINRKIARMLNGMKNAQEELEELGVPPTGQLVLRRFKKVRKTSLCLTDIYPEFLDYIKNETKRSRAYYDTNKAVYGALVKMKKLDGLDILNINFVDQIFLERFVTGLSNGTYPVRGKKVKNKSLKSYISMFAEFMKWAHSKGYHRTSYYNYFLTHLRTLAKVAVKSRPSLTLEEQALFAKHDFSKYRSGEKTLVPVQDRFIFLTQVPLRVGDLQKYGVHERIRTDESGMKYFDITTQKAKTRVEIPLSNIALRIIEKQGTTSGPIFKEEIKMGRFRDALKRMGEYCGLTKEIASTSIYGSDIETIIKPLNEYLTPHIGRYIFASNWYRYTKQNVPGFELEMLSPILGHSSTDMTLNYINSIWESTDREVIRYNIDRMSAHLE